MGRPKGGKNKYLRVYKGNMYYYSVIQLNYITNIFFVLSKNILCLQKEKLILSKKDRLLNLSFLFVTDENVVSFAT